MLDIHCHLLPGLDDGPSELSESLAMARAAAAAGVREVVCTPHQFDGRYDNPRPRILESLRAFRDAVEREKIPLALLPGAEVHLHPELLERLDRGEVMTYGDAGRAILLELPHDTVPEGTLDVVFELQVRKLKVVLAHPERNRGFLARPGRVNEFADRGVLLQITADSLAGRFGADVKRLAERIAAGGHESMIASDAHRASGRRSPLALPEQSPPPWLHGSLV